MTSLGTTAMERLHRRADRNEQGDTLIELLIAIVIIALIVTALLGGLVTAITSSSTQQSLSTVDSILNSFAQSAQYEAQQSFVNCTSTPYRLISAPLPASGPVGASVTVFVTGFAANAGLTVKVGSATAAMPNNASTDPNGDATVTFTVPNVGSGAQNVVVNDGTTSTTSPTPFVVVGSTTKGTTPVGYSISVGPVQQWNAQTSSWLAISPGTCPQSGAQQITAFAQGPPRSGASGTLSFVVLHPAATTVLVVATPTQGPLGSLLKFTATVIPPNSTTPNPTGYIQWTITGPNGPACNNSFLQVSAGNTSQATCMVPNAWAGTYDVTALYPAVGTTGYNYGTGSGSVVANIFASNSSTTITTTSSAPSPAQPGSTLSFTATVGANPVNPGDPQPDGTVTWTIAAPPGISPSCSQGGDIQNMNGTGSGTSSTTCSFTLPSNAPTGSYSATASFVSSNSNYNPSGSSPATISVNKATPTIAFSTGGTPQPGSSFTVKVTVNGNGTITPTGAIAWTVAGPPGSTPTCGPGTTVTLAAGIASCVVTLPGTAPTGVYTVGATYGGNTAYVGGVSGSTSVAVTLPPTGFNIQGMPSGAPNGKPGSGDAIVYTYNQVMSPNSIMAGLSTNAVNPSAVYAEFSPNGAQTRLTICTNQLCTGTANLGFVDLGGTYTSGFGSTILNATAYIATNANGQSVVTLTLGTVRSGNLNTVAGTTTLAWTPSNQATNTATPAVGCSTTLITETPHPGANF